MKPLMQSSGTGASALKATFFLETLRLRKKTCKSRPFHDVNVVICG